jgi:hypothetical protein
MERSGVTIRCLSCHLVNYGDLWYRERRMRVSKYRLELCPACQLRHPANAPRGGRRAAIRLGRVVPWEWANMEVGVFVSHYIFQPLARWLLPRA